MPSFLEIFFKACLGCTAWTYQPISRNRLASDCSKMIPSRQISTPQRSPTSVSSCLSPRVSVPNPHATVKLSGNGYSVQLHSVVASDVASNQGWMTVDTAVIRLNTSLTPSGRFPVYWNESLRRFGQVRLGFDAVVCVQKYEPWIIEAYNTSTGSSFASRIVEKQSNLDSTSLSPSGTIRGAQVENTRYLNTTGKDIVFSAAHGFSLNRFTEANDDLGRTTRGLYTPTSTVGPAVPPCATILLT